jgi:hypothetical protein
MEMGDMSTCIAVELQDKSGGGRMVIPIKSLEIAAVAINNSRSLILDPNTKIISKARPATQMPERPSLVLS